ncbi:PREDICTED: probable transcriptional regulator SLK2 [Populus euphratica]|uniref:Probable transcriptional regulator SLK2 n=1 Tax=Populus euphratica TaxID=75702 RepID=A0AAJ6V665_POPEU|nr:PREDICTED: probable transcriptional regulator SLK2 [Populus euphratica]XP_011041612.1 PREDICTED: probable transcriptional regulator SLK2 [Populus euphratica]XP_011041613.1 PREDICTED: probable transcriptional regulator SLK2 [Populus euphratica]XP_011041614.1 PREDICTED: probable transcriptional regulator SLK2 [Populus euphratica]
MAPSRVAGGLAQSSSSSGIFFQGDGQSKGLVNSRLSSSFGNSSNSIPGTGRPILGAVSGDMNNVVLNSVANSGPSVGASSLVTDANSALSGGPHLQRSASINTESYMRLPASPMSFSSNNISISGSSVVDGSSVVQQGNHQDRNVQQVLQNQQQQHGASSATSLPTSQIGGMSLPLGPRGQGSFLQDPNNLSQVQKKPRLDVKQEDILPQQVLQQLLQRQDSMQLQSRIPQLQNIFHQQRLRQQQQILQSMPPLQRAQLQQQQQQMQLRQQMQQQAMQPASSLKRPFDGGICARRLMQYLYHQRQRLAENTIAYWRKFVAEYYSPRAKKRWCLSLYDNVGHHPLGVFPQASMEVWQCEICGSKSGRGFEATFEVLPRLNEIKFGSGVIDELLFLDMPREFRLPSGIMMLEYAKAVQESVYEQLRVVREGQLRVIFTHDLKILSWEFCVRRHEELLPRRVVAPQVNQLLQVAQKCQSTIAESGSDGVSQQDLQTNSNMVLTASRQLAKSLELQSLNDLGFSKRYIRCLQISEVVNSMKDLIDFCREQKVGPIEGLKSYPRHATAAKLQMQKMQEMEQLASVQGLPTDRNTLNKLMALHPGINSHVNSNHQMVGRGTLSGPAQAALALTNFQNLLRRQNSMNSNSSSQQEAASPFNNSNQSPSSNFQGTTNFIPGSMQNLPVSGFSSPHLPPQQPQQMQQRSLSSNSLLQQSIPQSSQGNQAWHPHMIQQLLQEMSNNSGGGVQQHSHSGQSGNGGMTRSGLGFGSNTLATPPTASTVSVGAGGLAPSRSNSFKAAANSDSSAAGGNSGFNQKVLDLPPNLHLQDDLVSDIAHEFTENGFFNSDLDDNMGYGWKA